MELQDFIKTTLLNITKGVESANKDQNRFLLGGQKHHEKSIFGEYVEFDLSVIVDKQTSGSADGKIGVSLANIQIGKDAVENNQSTHRLKFKIFITENTQK